MAHVDRFQGENTPDYKVGEWRVQPCLNRIADQQVDQKTLAVLQLLVQSAPNAVSLNVLLDSVWSNRVVVENVVHKAIARLRRCFADNPKVPRYIETIRGRGYRLIAEIQWDDHLSRSAKAVLGVSELDVLSPDANLPKIAQGLREDLLAELHSAKDIQVVMSSDKQPTIPIDYLLHGSIRSSRHTAVVAFQLIDRDSNVLWASKYQVDTSRNTLTQFAKAPLVSRLIQSAINVVQSASNQTFQHSQAHEHWRNYQLERNKILLGADGSWDLAISYLEQLTHLEPEFAGSHQQLAICYADRLGLAIGVEEASQQAHHHIDLAIRIAPDAWLNYFVLGKVNHELDLDYHSAETNLRTAQTLGAPVGSVRTQLGIAFLKAALLDKSVQQFRDAVTSDPSSSAPANRIGWGLALMSQGDYGAAVNVFEKAEATAGSTEIAVNIRVQKAYACHFAGMPKLANVALDEALALAGDRKFLLPGALALLARDDLAADVITSLEAKQARGEFVRRSPMFLAYAFYENWDQAFCWLDRAIADRDGWIFPVLRCAPYLEKLRVDLRFEQVIANLNAIECRHG